MGNRQTSETVAAPPKAVAKRKRQPHQQRDCDGCDLCGKPLKFVAKMPQICTDPVYKLGYACPNGHECYVMVGIPRYVEHKDYFLKRRSYEELQEYAASLEARITALEKRSTAAESDDDSC